MRKPNGYECNCFDKIQYFTSDRLLKKREVVYENEMRTIGLK